VGWVVAGVVLVAASLLYGLHRVALWAEGHGWIYYRNKGRPRPMPIGIIDSIYQPSMEHVSVEAGEEAIRADHAETGDGEED
jgi:hypothetical protein